MTPVFADTLYWVALINPSDPWHEAVLLSRASAGSRDIITTDEVLVEVLAALSGGGAYLRKRAAVFIRSMLTQTDVAVLPQSHASFMAGLDLYERRPDKGYSLVDCISMVSMRERGITGALTNDHHFEQEGFDVLVQRQA